MVFDASALEVGLLRRYFEERTGIWGPSGLRHAIVFQQHVLRNTMSDIAKSLEVNGSRGKSSARTEIFFLIFAEIMAKKSIDERLVTLIKE